MGTDALRSAFEAAGHGGLRVHALRLEYARCGGQVIAVTGWHRDGALFSTTSAVFRGDPIARVQHLARDLIQMHYGDHHMSRNVSGLARLMTALNDIHGQADALADRFASAQAGLTGEMATTSQIVSGVEQARDELTAINRLYSNGGPAGPLPGSAGS